MYHPCLKEAYEVLETAKMLILAVDATNGDKAELDKAYNSLQKTMKTISQLLNGDDE